MRRIDSQASYAITPRVDSEALHFNFDNNTGAGANHRRLNQDNQQAQPEAAPNPLPAPAQTRLISQPKI